MSERGSFFSFFTKEKRQLALEIAKLPKIKIDLFGDDVARQAYEDFTSPHRLMPFVAKKSFGAALIDLSDEEVSSLSTLKYARRRYNRSLKHGHVFRKFDAVKEIDALMEINKSTNFRQGSQLTENYFDRQHVEEVARKETPSFGIFSSEDKLLAYTHAPIIGDAFVYSWILGHDEYLQMGTMFHLVADTNRWMREHYIANRYPRWAFYDMFLGSSSGLRYFKEKAGFVSYRVTWRWAGEIKS